MGKGKNHNKGKGNNRRNSQDRGKGYKGGNNRRGNHHAGGQGKGYQHGKGGNMPQSLSFAEMHQAAMQGKGFDFGKGAIGKGYDSGKGGFGKGHAPAPADLSWGQEAPPAAPLPWGHVSHQPIQPSREPSFPSREPSFVPWEQQGHKGGKGQGYDHFGKGHGPPPPPNQGFPQGGKGFGTHQGGKGHGVNTQFGGEHRENVRNPPPIDKSRPYVYDLTTESGVRYLDEDPLEGGKDHGKGAGYDFNQGVINNPAVTHQNVNSAPVIRQPPPQNVNAHTNVNHPVFAQPQAIPNQGRGGMSMAEFAANRGFGTDGRQDAKGSGKSGGFNSSPMFQPGLYPSPHSSPDLQMLPPPSDNVPTIDLRIPPQPTSPNRRRGLKPSPWSSPAINPSPTSSPPIQPINGSGAGILAQAQPPPPAGPPPPRQVLLFHAKVAPNTKKPATVTIPLQVDQPKAAPAAKKTATVTIPLQVGQPKAAPTSKKPATVKIPLQVDQPSERSRRPATVPVPVLKPRSAAKAKASPKRVANPKNVPKRPAPKSPPRERSPRIMGWPAIQEMPDFQEIQEIRIQEISDDEGAATASPRAERAAGRAKAKAQPRAEGARPQPPNVLDAVPIGARPKAVAPDRLARIPAPLRAMSEPVDHSFRPMLARGQLQIVAEPHEIDPIDGESVSSGELYEADPDENESPLPKFPVDHRAAAFRTSFMDVDERGALHVTKPRTKNTKAMGSKGLPNPKMAPAPLPQGPAVVNSAHTTRHK